MTEDEYYIALSARPRVRYVAVHSLTGVAMQTFIDPALAQRAIEDDPTLEVIKMAEVTDPGSTDAEVEAIEALLDAVRAAHTRYKRDADYLALADALDEALDDE